MIVDQAIYVDGQRTEEPGSLEETYETQRQQGGIAWIDLYQATEEELSSVAQEFGLHHLAVEDASKAHQRAKLERYGDTLFFVLKAVSYHGPQEAIELTEVHIFVGENFVFTVRHGNIPALDKARRWLEGEPELLRRGPEAILYAIMDQIVDCYGPVMESVRTAIEEIEEEVYRGKTSVSRRIHELSGEVFQFQRAT